MFAWGNQNQGESRGARCNNFGLSAAAQNYLPIVVNPSRLAGI